ncbi:MAG: hypothetical protein KOO62_06890 [candidate division Zixibacteria bacterium]|nr:hypothetical protein [candidate division Zixibacteria bacterium]
MDSLQGWWGYYFKLDSVFEVLQSLPEERQKETKNHELFITWVVARFLQWQTGSEHAIGFPSLEGRDDLTLRSLLNGVATIDDEDFDTVMIDTREPEREMRLQIKRYMRRQHPSTDDFFKFMRSKVERYGDSPKLCVVFDIREEMGFDLRRFAQLLRGQTFKVGSIVAFIKTKSEWKCGLLSIHPEFSGKVWGPDSESKG